MKNAIKLILFLTYTIIVFLITNYYIIGALFLINIGYIIIGKINIKNVMYNIWRFFNIYITDIYF